MKYTIFFLFLTFIISYGKAADGQNSKFRYWFVLDKCSTGKHYFKNKIEMCEALQNEKLNNGCSLILRQDEFRKMNCSGEFKSFNNFDNSKEKILCEGVISNDNKEFEIKREIYWDPNYSQRFNIVEYEQIPTVGTVVLDLIKADKESFGEMRLAAVFLDNNKFLAVSGSSGATLKLKHLDRRYVNRRVDLTCSKESKKSVINRSFEKEEEAICFGNKKQKGSKEESFYLTIPHSNNDYVRVDSKSLFLIQKKISELRIFNHPLEDIVEVDALVANSLLSVYKYISAWDSMEINLQCVPKSYIVNGFKFDNNQEEGK